jgi:alpha-1,3-fucosyltransferase
MKIIYFRFTFSWKWIFVLLFFSKLILLLKNFPLKNPTRLRNIVNISFSFPNKKITKNKSILIWNQAQLIETAVFGFGHQPFLDHGCEVSDCTIFDNETSLPIEEYDAIVLHMCLIWLSEIPNFQRQAYQRFIFFTAESPDSIIKSLPDIISMKHYFNWTMSYRLNSDIRLLYGRIEPKTIVPKTEETIRELIKETHQPSAKNFANKKTLLVVWMASHCKTPGLRETYIRKLSTFIQVDIYGRCGNLSCPRNKTHSYSNPTCYDLLEAKYKFYLSFENSICEDYVTEKFFEIMKRDMVPIVYGGAKYSDIAPPHSYIDATQYTPEGLAHYLKLLDANDKLYNEYFWWKGHYEVHAGVEQMARNGFCDLCKKLHQDQNVTKYYSELITEWHPKTKCKYFTYSDTESKDGLIVDETKHQ